VSFSQEKRVGCVKKALSCVETVSSCVEKYFLHTIWQIQYSYPSHEITTPKSTLPSETLSSSVHQSIE
jgi:hypothetical protein